MTKVMALLRTIVLFVIVGYLIWALPLGILLSSAKADATFKVEVLEKVASGGWLAAGWIGIETAFGWIRVWAEGRRKLKALKAEARASADAAAASRARPPPDAASGTPRP